MERGTSVSALVRDYLRQLAGQSAAAEGVTEFVAATKGAAAGSRRPGGGCDRILSEDLNSGQTMHGVTVQSPFAT